MFFKKHRKKQPSRRSIHSSKFKFHSKVQSQEGTLKPSVHKIHNLKNLNKCHPLREPFSDLIRLKLYAKSYLRVHISASIIVESWYVIEKKVRISAQRGSNFFLNSGNRNPMPFLTWQVKKQLFFITCQQKIFKSKISPRSQFRQLNLTSAQNIICVLFFRKFEHIQRKII